MGQLFQLTAGDQREELTPNPEGCFSIPRPTVATGFRGFYRVRRARVAFPVENVFGELGQDQWLGADVVLQQVVVDHGFQIVDAGVAPPVDMPEMISTAGAGAGLLCAAAGSSATSRQRDSRRCDRTTFRSRGDRAEYRQAQNCERVQK